jgi:hypothetical protein
MIMRDGSTIRADGVPVEGLFVTAAVRRWFGGETVHALTGAATCGYLASLR